VLASYFTLAVRHLLKHRFYAVLNILGLSIGVGCLIVAVLYFDYHLQYDGGHERIDRIYRIIRHVRDAEGPHYDLGDHAAAPMMLAEIPEVEEATRVLNRPMIVTAEDRSFTEQVAVVDSSFTRIFTVSMVRGNDQTGLLKSGSCFLSQTLAQKLFPDGDVLGQTISISYKWLEGEFTVTGIFRDPGDRTTYPLRYGVLTATYPPNDYWKGNVWETWPSRYFSFPIRNFLLVRAGTGPAQLDRQLDAFSDRHPSIVERREDRWVAQPFAEAHLYTQRDYGIPTGEDINRCIGIMGIGLLVLVLACLNYVNLVTAQSPQRAREVGLRKASGALRSNLVGQFLGESLLFAALGFTFALVLAYLSLPTVGSMLGVELDLRLASTSVWGVIPLIVLVVGLLAGTYPAFVLSSHTPVQAVKGTRSTPGRAWLRKGLVTFQFTASGILLVGTLVVQKQIDYALSKDLGYYHDRMVLMPMVMRSPDRGATMRRLPAIRDQLRALPGVTHATGIFLLPGYVSSVDLRDVTPEDGTDKVRLHYMGCDEEFFDAFEIPFVAGGIPNPDHVWRRLGETESVRSVVLNETAADLLGWKDVAIGKRAYVDYAADDGKTYRSYYEVSGVVRDYHNQSLHEGIRPLMIHVPGTAKHVVVRLGDGDLEETLAGVKEVWDTFMNGIPFEFRFVDEIIQERYLAELRLRQVLRFFTGLSILVGCLGVLGLVSYTAQQRTREIGIRKVLGADHLDILRLLSLDFAKLSVVSFAIAWPIAYSLGSDWLANFAYRTELGVLPFLISGAFILLVLAVTVGVQSWRSASRDPVVSLRQE